MPVKYNADIFEGYLDKNNHYYDYGTAPYTGDGNVVDMNHTGMSFYDQFLGTSELDYLRDKKNLKGTVVKMTPKEYYRNCSYKIFNTSTEKLKRERGEYDRPIIEKLKNVVNVYKRKLCMPMINYADRGQEGLHRMLAIAEMFGWDYEVPVLVVDWYDPERAETEKREAKQAEIDRKVRKAVSATLEYRFVDTEDVALQLQAELDRVFEFDETIKIPETLKLKETANALSFVFEGSEYPIDKDDIQWKDDTDIEWDDIDVDDIELEDNEDFLIRYFGKDWRKTHPHLKDTFNITESITRREMIYQQVCSQVRHEVVKKYTADFLYGKCIEASERIVELLATNGLAAKTVEGWVKYDSDEGCSDRDYDEHTWVETVDGYILDVTATQFNSFMFDDYPEVIISKQLPDGYTYEEPRYLEESFNDEDPINKNVIIEVLEEHNHSYYQDSNMALEMICEELFYHHKIDARYRGRSIYIGEKKIATIKVEREGPGLLGMYGYTLFI